MTPIDFSRRSIVPKTLSEIEQKINAMLTYPSDVSNAEIVLMFARLVFILKQQGIE